MVVLWLVLPAVIHDVVVDHEVIQLVVVLALVVHDVVVL